MVCFRNTAHGRFRNPARICFPDFAPGRRFKTLAAMGTHSGAAGFGRSGTLVLRGLGAHIGRITALKRWIGRLGG